MEIPRVNPHESWDSRAVDTWRELIREQVNLLSKQPVAQMTSLNVTPGVTIAPGEVIKPYAGAWEREIAADATNGTLTVTRTGIYIFSTNFSGTPGAANADIFFALRLNGVEQVVIESSVKQRAEGVQATLTGFARLPINGVVDTVVTSDSESSVTLTNLVIGLGWYSTLEGAVQTVGAAARLFGSGQQLQGDGQDLIGKATGSGVL